MVYDEKYVKDIITDESKLHEWCDEIDPRKNSKLVQEIILCLKNTIRKNNLVALSAPAIGYNYRIFCVAFDKGANIKTFINPFISVKGFNLRLETCSSIPGKRFLRPRHPNTVISYVTPLEGKPETRKINGEASAIIQHEMDHINGILINDVGLEIDDDFESLTDEEKDTIVRMYLDSLDKLEKASKEAVQSDDETKQIDDAINYMESIDNGETIIEKDEVKTDE